MSSVRDGGDLEAFDSESVVSSISPPRRRRISKTTSAKISQQSEISRKTLSPPRSRTASDLDLKPHESLEICETTTPEATPVLLESAARSIHSEFFDSKIDEQPIRAVQRLLILTELPFLILLYYLTFWVTIVVFTHPLVPKMVWLTGTIAGVLVGIALNANAYRYVFGETIDYVTAVRFFLIPFGVSTLTGITNSLRERFIMVFPKDPLQLTISLATPSAVVTFFFLARIVLLWKLSVKWRFRVLFFNGNLVS
eukprot:GHVP01010479.1.p2 GENE.GHVP01010479.1~~GHVP01010479.1.p2  ORF type:complete len:254 (-),score=28.03 GHVP01010479.1:86-847(-)